MALHCTRLLSQNLFLTMLMAKIEIQWECLSQIHQKKPEWDKPCPMSGFLELLLQQLLPKNIKHGSFLFIPIFLCPGTRRRPQRNLGGFYLTTATSKTFGTWSDFHIHHCTIQCYSISSPWCRRYCWRQCM